MMSPCFKYGKTSSNSGGEGARWTIKGRSVNGHEGMNIVGLQPGPKVSKILGEHVR